MEKITTRRSNAEITAKEDVDCLDHEKRRTRSRGLTLCICEPLVSQFRHLLLVSEGNFPTICREGFLARMNPRFAQMPQYFAGFLNQAE